MEKYVLSEFINNIPEVLWWKDLNSVFVGCNNGFVKMLGLDNPSQVIGKTDYDFFPKEEADFFQKIDQEIVASGKKQLNFEEVITMPDKGQRWLSTSKVPLYDDENNLIGTAGWFNDITAIKEMQIQIDEKSKDLLDYSARLEKSNRELELANIDLENFTYAVSHDLKGPILTIKSFSDLIKQKSADKLDPKTSKYVDFIHESAIRMESLIRDILSYGMTGTQQLVSESVELQTLINGKLLDLNQLIESKSAVVNLNLPKEKVNCYPNLIGLLFYNLINNGIKFNQSEIPTVNCGFQETEDKIIFKVEDNGIGIKAENAQKIFEPFKRMVGQEFEGSGIGLSICKKVAMLHRGKIWLDKSEAGATSFKFSIPKKL